MIRRQSRSFTAGQTLKLLQHAFANQRRSCVIIVSVEEKIYYAKGWPPKNGKRKVSKVRHVIKAHIEEKAEQIKQIQDEAGCFVLLTNVSRQGDGTETGEELLQAYKEQNGIERNFAFLKDPLIVNDMFLKKPERIEVKLLNVGEAIKSFQIVIELGDSQDDFVKIAKELVGHMAHSISKDTGLTLDLYLKSMDDFNKAFSTMQNREYEKAIAEFQNVIKNNPTNAQTYGNLGLCYAFLGQQEKAVAAFDQALKIDPDYEPATTNKAIVLSLKGGEKLPDNHIQTIEYYKDVAEQMENNSHQ